MGKPSVIQNRFHANRGFYVNMHSIFQSYNIQIQRFWVLTGNGGGRRNEAVAKEKNVTSEQLMLGFVMALGDTPLVGTHKIAHIKDDIDMVNRYKDIFHDMEGED